MQTTDALADYTSLTLEGLRTPKGSTKGSKRSAPGDDAPLAAPAKQNMEPNVPKILKRVILFSGPSLLCTDAAQKNGFPFKITKDQHQFLEDWAQQRSQASNHGVRYNTIMNCLDSSRQVSIAVHFSKVPIFSVATSRASISATSSSSLPPQGKAKNPSKGSSKGKTNNSAQAKSEAKGHGDMADMARLNKVFGGVDFDFQLSVPDSSYVLLDGLDELLQQHLLNVTSEDSVSSLHEARQSRNDSSRERGTTRATPQRPHTPPRDYNSWYEPTASSSQRTSQHSTWTASSDWSTSWWNVGSSSREASWSRDSNSYSSHSWYQEKRQR